MKIMIAVPCMDQVPYQFAHSLCTLKKEGECCIVFEAGSLVYTSRNDLARKAIDMEADYVFWLDSDMVFAPDTLLKLLEDRDKGDIISGLYYRRVEPYKPVLFQQLDIDEKGCKWTHVHAVPKNVFEIGGCGFGCVLMPTNIFMDVFNRFGAMFDPIAQVGEDLSFCWRARAVGYKIVCDPNVKLGHVGHYIVTEDFYNAYNLARNRDESINK